MGIAGKYLDQEFLGHPRRHTSSLAFQAGSIDHMKGAEQPSCEKDFRLVQMRWEGL